MQKKLQKLVWTDLILVAAGAGGHGGTLHPIPFIAEVKKFFKKTILLSGCISNGTRHSISKANGS